MTNPNQLPTETKTDFRPPAPTATTYDGESDCLLRKLAKANDEAGGTHGVIEGDYTKAANTFNIACARCAFFLTFEKRDNKPPMPLNYINIKACLEKQDTASE